MNNYKADIDTNRSDTFSPLYIVISKIGLSCVTYFMVGLMVSMVYVLSDMDYFTLNGQFRTQRFFTDDGYYYNKQLVIIYGLFAFMLTMFVGPVGIIPCIIWSWILTISYISMSVYMNSTNPDMYNRLMIRFLGFISFVSHSLLCNFIFYLFYPINSMFSNYIYDYNITSNNTTTNNINNNNNTINNNNRTSYSFYRILSFMFGYFMGCSLLSFVLSIKTDITNNTYTINYHNNDLRLLLALLIASSISMCNSLLLSFQFVYEYILRVKLLYKNSNTNNSSNNLNINGSFIDRSMHMMDTGTFVWFPMGKHTNNVISKNFHSIIDVEMIVIWVLNPFVISIIPYTIPSHFDFIKQSFIHKLLFSLLFIIIFMFLNEDLIFSYLFPNEYINNSVFNIVYSNQYIQLKDDHLYLNPVSFSNNNINCDLNNFNLNKMNAFNFNSVSYKNFHKSLVLYPHFDETWDFIDYENILLSFFIYNVLNLLYVSSQSLIDSNSYIYYSYTFNSLSFNKQNNNNQNNLYIYFYNEYNYDIVSILLNPVDNHFYDISNISLFDYWESLKVFYNIYNKCSLLNELAQRDVTHASTRMIPTINVSKKSVSSLFKKQYIMLIISKEDETKDTNIISNLFNRIDSKNINLFILNLLSTTSTKDHRILVSLFYKYTDKGLKILQHLEKGKNCSCFIKFKPSFGESFYKLESVFSTYFYSYFKKNDRNGNHLCICIVIMDVLRPKILICIKFILYYIIDIFYTSYRRFDKNNFSCASQQMITKIIIMLFDILYKVLGFIYKLFPRLTSECFCKEIHHTYYGFIINLILHISSLMEKIFTSKNEEIQKHFMYLSNLFSLLKYYNRLIGLKDNYLVELKECKCLCTHGIRIICECKCDEKEKPFTECCCIICKNCKIICLTICFGCQLCCISCDKKCSCHEKVKSWQCDVPPKPKSSIAPERGIWNLLQFTAFWIIFTREYLNPRILCPCQHICEILKIIQECNKVNGCDEICKNIKELFNSQSKLDCQNKCICEHIFNKIKGAEEKCKQSLSKIKEKINSKIKCTGNNKCCCKIGLSSVNCLYKMSRSISWYLYNQYILQCINCCKQMKIKPKIYLENMSTYYKNILITSKNNRICDSMCDMEAKSRCDNNNNIYNQNTSNEHKLKQSRIIIVLGLIFLILSMRMIFDTSENNISILKPNGKLLFNNGEYNDKIQSINDIGKEQINEYNNNQNQNNITNGNINNNIKRNRMMYFLTMLFSLISALYMNMVIRNLYDTLRLEYDIWSYLINMILMTGMMSSLLTKYSVHVFDFVGVLDKYGMNLSKSDSFIDYVDRSDPDFIDHFSSPVKNMMMYGLFKSMTKDLRTLTRFKDVTSTSSTTTYSKLRHKLYPYKDMTKPVHKLTKHCDKCQHSLCNIHKSVINNFGTKESIDIVSVLDFLSYSMIYNNMSFVSQYESYFTGDELYVIWKLNKHMSNNVFIAEYYRHQTLNKIEQEIKQLINNDHKLGTSNLMLLWEVFGDNEIKNITLKSMSDINEQQMIKDQREVLASILYDEYLRDFVRFQQYVCNTMFNSKVVVRQESLNIKSIREFANILNKHVLDKSKLQELIYKYSKDFHDRKIKSLKLPTVFCNIRGTHEQITKNFISHSFVWLKNKHHFCKQMKSLECERAVHIAYNTIINLINKPGDLYQQIYDLLTNIDLTKMDNIFDISSDYTPKMFKPLCRDCESISMYYISQYFSSTHTNIDKMLTPLGMYLSWHGTPIDKHHLNKCSHTQ